MKSHPSLTRQPGWSLGKRGKADKERSQVSDLKDWEHHSGAGGIVHCEATSRDVLQGWFHCEASVQVSP